MNSTTKIDCYRERPRQPAGRAVPSFVRVISGGMGRWSSSSQVGIQCNQDFIRHARYFGRRRVSWKNAARWIGNGCAMEFGGQLKKGTGEHWWSSLNSKTVLKTFLSFQINKLNKPHPPLALHFLFTHACRALGRLLQFACLAWCPPPVGTYGRLLCRAFPCSRSLPKVLAT